MVDHPYHVTFIFLGPSQTTLLQQSNLLFKVSYRSMKSKSSDGLVTVIDTALLRPSQRSQCSVIAPVICSPSTCELMNEWGCELCPHRSNGDREWKIWGTACTPYASEMGLVFWAGTHTQSYTCSVWENGGGASTAACYGESGSNLQKTGTAWVSLRRRNLASFRWELLLISGPEVYGWVSGERENEEKEITWVVIDERSL